MMPNQLIGRRYLIKRPLGEGGMANVYLAHDLILDRDVSIKTMRFDLLNDEKTINRFRREAMAATELVHPNIITVYDFDEEDSLQYLVMEYIDGMDLKTYIKNNFPLPLQEVVKILKQVLSAVSAAHDAGIIHRDLKPQNILIDNQGNAKISDFGIAMTKSELALTQTNTILGSIHYLSPEQTRGGMATNKSDVYSLGIILYEMLVGQVPFGGDNAVAIAIKHSETPIPFVRNFNRSIPQALENVVLKATAKDPIDRYTSVNEMLIDLRTALDASRTMEPRFVPGRGDEDVTRVIPVQEIAAAQKQPEIKESETKGEAQGANEKKPRRKYRWLWLSVVVVIMLSISGAFAFMQHDNVIVPNVVNKTQTKAVALIQDKGLKVGTITKTTSATIAEGNVVTADPKSKHKVSRGTSINLVISSGKKLLRFGDYTNEEYDEVSKVLMLKGYQVTETQQPSNDVPNGLIISQSIDADAKVDPENTSVIFIVSSGPQKVKVPDFTGQPVTAFYNWANVNGIKILQPTTAYDSKVESDKIISQSIPAGQSAVVGDTMQVVVSNGPRETENKQPAPNSSSADKTSNSSTSSTNSSSVISSSSSIENKNDNNSQNSSGN